MKQKIAIITVMLVILTGFTLQAQKYGEDSLACVENLSLYKINYRIWKDHKYSADVVQQVPILDPWRWVFFNCPESSQNIYVDGIKIIEYYYNQESDEALKQKYIDTLMLIYDNRIKYFGQANTSREGLVLGRKGVDLYKYRPEEFVQVYDILDKSISLEANKSIGSVIVYYFRTTISMAKSGKIDSAVIIDNYDKVSEIIDYNLKLNQNNERKAASWLNVKGNIESSFEPFATCEDFIKIYSKKFNESPDDIELMKKITKILDRKGCNDSELFFETTKKLHTMEPTAESAYLMGVMNIKKEAFQSAADYLEQSVDLLEDVDKKGDAFYLLANIYMNLGKYAKARSFANDGLSVRPEDGSFYIIIGDLYAITAKDCGDNELTKRVAYWAAVDKYYTAKSVDSSVEEEANKRISSYKGLFPSVETIFFYDLKEGDPYTVGCWINERTTVRASN